LFLVYGSSQVGYIILDPQTGAGAYKIGGGENGGELSSLNSLATPMVYSSLILGSSFEEEKLALIFILENKFKQWVIPTILKLNCLAKVIADFSDALLLLVTLLGLNAASKTTNARVRQVLEKFKLVTYLFTAVSAGALAVNFAMCVIDRE
jgi:hypothetical protein